LGAALDEGTARYLLNNKSPSRKAGELDNRGSHYYLAMYWAQAMAQQSDAPELALRFAAIAAELEANEAAIVAELNSVQGVAADIGGYYLPNEDEAIAAMRPSTTLNRILDAF
jgi:isocitrate dehydrogenase